MNVGEKIQLTKLNPEIEKCKECEKQMVNLDVDQLALGDLATLKKAGVRISNPNTDKSICISCEYKTFGRKVADFFESDDDDDDSSFFGSGGGFSGGSSSGGWGGFSGGGFGGFGGGSFSGGGASRGF